MPVPYPSKLAVGKAFRTAHCHEGASASASAEANGAGERHHRARNMGRSSASLQGSDLVPRVFDLAPTHARGRDGLRHEGRCESLNVGSSAEPDPINTGSGSVEVLRERADVP